MTELVDIVQVSKSRDQTDNRAQNAKCRCIRARLREHRTPLGVALLHDRQLCVQHIADEIRVHSIDDHAQPRAEERILNLLRLAFKCENSLTARDL